MNAIDNLIQGIRSRIVERLRGAAMGGPLIGFSRSLQAARNVQDSRLPDIAAFTWNGFGVNRLLATNPRSGYNLVWIALSLAYEIGNGGKGRYDYVEGKWRLDQPLFHSCDYRTPLSLDETLNGSDLPQLSPDERRRVPYVYHSHRTYEMIPIVAKRRMRTVVLVRNLWDQVESWLFHQGYDEASQAAFISDGYLDASIAFLNSWGRQAERRDNVTPVRYEDLLSQKTETLARIAAALEIPLSAESIERAAEVTDKQTMRSKIPDSTLDTNPQVSAERLFSFSPEIRARIQRAIDEDLRYAFGYDYRT